MRFDKQTGGRSEVRFFRLTAALLLLVIALAAPGLADPSRPGDCVACHTDDDVLPPSHPPTEGMTGAQCMVCHQDDSPLALQTKMPLSHFHMLGGVTCETCHADMSNPGPLSTEQCLVCHGPLEELAARTADVKPHNPHSSPHGPAYAQCDLCHYQHQPSENFCADCHDFEFKVP